MPKEEIIEPQPASSLAIVSLVLGIVSLTGPGLLLGIPAIITSIIALKKGSGGRGLSIAGLITGIVSTVFSVLFIALIILLAVWGAAHPENFNQPEQNGTTQQHAFDSSRT